MNPLIADVLEAKARQDVEIASLEQTFERDCKCEAKEHRTGPCTEKATHRFTTCYVDENACTRFAIEAQTDIQSEDYICGGCEKDLDECWTIRPI